MRICTFPGCSAQAFYPSKLPRPGEPAKRPTRCYTHRPRRALRQPPPPAGDDMPRLQPNRELLEVNAWLPGDAKAVSIALEHISREFAIADSLPDHTPGAAPPIRRFYATCTGRGGTVLDDGRLIDVEPCPGCDLCEPQHYSATEREALAKLRLTRFGEQIRDDIKAIRQLRESIARVSSKVLGIRIPVEVRRCDGRPFEGSDILWVPHSRDPENGWYDPTCADAADESGLCNRCRVREYRYRSAHDLAPREHNASAPAA